MQADMNLNQLRIFHAVARLLSFTRASEELYLTQPGISKHIKELEGYYGTRLFDRLGKRVVLTQAGEILFRITKDIFNLIHYGGQSYNIHFTHTQWRPGVRLKY